VDGEPYLVVAGRSLRGGQAMYFFFPRRDLLDSITEVRDVLAVGWLVAVLAAAALGNWVARRTLRPVRTAAEASLRLAQGDLTTRLAGGADDEFGILARSFNEMADALDKKVTELEQAAERERRFTSDVAHDLRTPLTTIVSAASLLEEELGSMPAAARRPTELLLHDIRRLHALVLDLLTLARLEDGEEALHLEVLDVASAVGAVVAGASAPAPVVVDAEDGLAVVADRVRFRAALGNVVQNAFVHGAGPVHVRAYAEDGAVVIDVLDRGPGLAAGDVERVFDRFYKVDSSRTGPGSGLGLAIARGNVELQGGTITATNRPGGGACFEIRLPRWQGEAGPGLRVDGG
jgi:two-component system sensor histidine kinase MtrB